MFSCFMTDQDGSLWSECKTMLINNHGKVTKVRKLDEDEAKALITREYGFEFGSIKIMSPCWYESSDWNFFDFMIRNWRYEVHDFGALQAVDFDKHAEPQVRKVYVPTNVPMIMVGFAVTCFYDSTHFKPEDLPDRINTNHVTKYIDEDGRIIE